MSKGIIDIQFNKFRIICDECNTGTLNIKQDLWDETVIIKCNQCGNEEIA